MQGSRGTTSSFLRPDAAGWGVLSACTSNGAGTQRGRKAVDVAAVVRQKNARQREGQGRMGAGDCQNLRKSEAGADGRERSCSVLAVAQQESNYQSDPVVPGLSKIAGKR